MKYSHAYAIALASVAVALPQRAHPRAEDPGLATAQGGNRRIYIHESCSEDEHRQIAESIDDAQKLANALNTWVPAGKNQDVMDMYMGTNSSSEGNIAGQPGASYREVIQNNIIREAAYYEPPSTANHMSFITCHEDIYWPNKAETTCPPEGVYGWTWNLRIFGTERIEHYMTLCPKYFKSPTLAGDVQRAQDDAEVAKFLDGLHTNTAATFFHETFHMDYTVGDPTIWDNPDNIYDGIYGAGNIAEWAATRNAAATMLIAESYTMAGLAIYYRDTLGLTDFPKPKPKAESDSTVIRKKLGTVDDVQGATDPKDPNSIPSEDEWTLL